MQALCKHGHGMIPLDFKWSSKAKTGPPTYLAGSASGYDLPANAAQLKSFLQSARVIVVEEATKAPTSATQV